MTLLSEYIFMERINLGGHHIAYRAERRADKQKVILKILKSTNPATDELSQFKNECEILEKLSAKGIPQYIGLEQQSDRYVMVLEDFEGVSLEKYIQQHKPGITACLNIGISIAEILEALHQQNIVHQNITSHNLLINPANLEVQLIDFSFASLISKKTHTAPQLTFSKGSLAYTSPEQTGRIKSGIDHRSDLYAAGIILYEMSTGKRPFEAEDPMELVHSQLAKNPVPPHQLTIAVPPVFSEIVLKLMAKNAEDRYQSAFGLKPDLEYCLSQWIEKGKIESFLLAQQDVSGKVQLSPRLFGREKETQILLQTFAQASEGAVKVVMIEGYSGVGKTALVQQIHKPIALRNGFLLTGKFNQFQQNLPYFAFIEAFKEFTNLLLTESAEKREQWRNKILEATGSNGKILTDIIPHLELLIGKQPDVPELEPNEALNRFHYIFRNFIKAIAHQQHPLVLFFDDLQWADAASLSLLNVLLIDKEIHYLLFTGAYRDNEIDANPAFVTFLEELPSGSTDSLKITLSPLSFSDVQHLVAEALHCRPEYAQSLAELIYNKSQGNAFFVNEFLKSLYEEDLLLFDFSQKQWHWDIGQIRQLNITKNVVEFMAGKIQKLPEITQEILKTAACLGTRFDVNTLALIYQNSVNEIAGNLRSALEEGLIIEIDKNYRFSHDRIQQAVYSLISPSLRKHTHLYIGSLLRQHMSKEQQHEFIFEIANQFNIGLDLIHSQPEKIKLAELNLSAGIKAKNATAYQPSFQYLETGISLLPHYVWKDNYALALGLYTEGAESAFLCGNTEIMDTWIENVLLNAGTVLDKVRVYEIKIKSYIAHHRLMDAVSTALQVLSLLDIHFPHKPNKLHVLYALAQIYITLGYRKIEDLVEMPAMKNPHKEAAIRILASVGSAAYFAFPDFFPLLVCKAFHMIIKYGNTPYSGFVCASYGLIVLGGLRDIRTSYRLGKTALQLIEKASSPHLSCRTGMMTNTFLFHWNEHLKHSLPSLYEAQQKGLETGDIEFTTYSIMVRCHNRLFLGDSLSEVSSEMLAMGKVIAELRQEIPLNMHNIFTQATLNLITPCEHPVFITGSVHNESEMLPFYRQTKAEVAIFQLFVCKLMMACLFDDHSQTEEILSVCGSHFKSIPASPFVPMYFMYESLARLNNLAEKHPDSQTLKIIKRNQKKLKNFARYAPMNSLHKFYLVKAELCRVTGKTQKAVALYEKASIQAKANGYVQEEALAYELAGRFYKSRQQLSLAQFYLQKAYKVYHEWGAFSKTRRMQQQYRPFFDESLEEKTDVLALQGIHAVADNLYTKFSNETSTVLFDLNSIMKAATAISSEIQLDKLLEKLIKIAVENAGAQKGYFILCKENAFFIEAESSVDEEEVIIASVPLRNNVSVSESIIQYAYLTKENVVLSNAIADPKFAADPVIVKKSSKSILCTPIINQMQVVGLLYFENNLTTSAFTQDRIELLRLLSGQMAVSIENALNEEKKVAAYQEREQLLKKINHQQEIIARSILKTQENERRRIAEDLHDGLGYTLSTLKLNLTSLQEIVKDNDDGKFLHNSFLLLEESFRELKSISNNLMPDILFRFGLIVAIDDLCKKINNTGQLFINFRYFNIKKKFRKDFEIEVFRVLQELINNTIKHAEAKHLEIQFVNQGNLLVITVEDDGKGFDYQKKLKSKNKGKGLINIINRINFLQGELHVESGLNKGTTFILHLPLHVKSAKPLDHDKVTSSRRSSAFH